MTHSVEGNVAEVLSEADAHVHECWVDDFDNVWEVREDREAAPRYGARQCHYPALDDLRNPVVRSAPPLAPLR